MNERFGTAMPLTAALHHSQVITIRGDSNRLRDMRRAGLVKVAAAVAAQEMST